MSKRTSEAARVPKRDYLSPTVAMLCRLALASPTDRPAPMNQGDKHVLETPQGKITVTGYRPHERNMDVVSAVIGERKIDEFVIAKMKEAGTTYTVRIDVREIAPKCHMEKHPLYVWQALGALIRTRVEIRPTGWKAAAMFGVVTEVIPDDENGYTGTVSFTGKFIQLWALDVCIYCERMLPEIAAIAHPTVRALVKYCLGSKFVNEPLLHLLENIDALDVSRRKQDERLAAVRRANRDGTLARFGIAIRRTADGAEKEHVFFERDSLVGEGLVQLPGSALAAALAARLARNENGRSSDVCSPAVHPPHGGKYPPHGESQVRSLRTYD